jgi:valyl-tRNA synthetase
MEKNFESAAIEAEVHKLWEAAKAFHADPDQPGDSYCIVIPPPNVTAALHLGHALNNTLQDILIRANRMRGRNALWMPGTDHAGIATQTVVEKRLLREEGKRRTDFSRDSFIAQVQAWKDQYEAVILGQLRAMGCSCDWDRTRFTMDEICARAVRENFFRLFRDELVYRGLRLVNWDPVTQTVLADDEVEMEEVQTSFYYLRYPLEKPVTIEGESISYVVVATTRPETMLGDTAVALNPRDPRAAALVGQTVILPIVNRRIPIVADDYVVLPDPESSEPKARYSTGFLKVTPAHDENDWSLGQRHKLPVINIFAPDASISPDYGWKDGQGTEAEQFYGQDRYVARKAIVAWFEAKGLLHETRPYSYEIGHSYRSHVPIEPYLSRQWYVAVKKPISRLAEHFGAGNLEGVAAGCEVPKNSLAGLALEPLLGGRLRFVPERYSRGYQSWHENLRDWPISRQLWWGHQIPIWSKAGEHKLSTSRDVALARTEIEDEKTISYACVAPGHADIEAELEAQGWTRDPDVLDTWFSSALWPFSTLGWPEHTPELARYYPGNVLCTAREIITLWVSRMVMMGQYNLAEIPFSDVFIHAMILDGEGRKMSKTLGNGIDPLVIIDSHGSDAMRYTLCAMTTQTQDIRIPVSKVKLPDGREINTSEKFDIGRKLCTKLWNATRFVLQQIEGLPTWEEAAAKEHLAERWILSRLSQTITSAQSALDEYRYSELADTLYRFLYDDFCDWYVEVAKARISAGAATPKAVLAFVVDQFLRLFHPIAPFITESLARELEAVAPQRGSEASSFGGALALASWPKARKQDLAPEVEARFSQLQDLVRETRNARKTNNIAPGQALNAHLETPAEALAWLPAAMDILESQARLEKVTLSSESPAAEAGTGIVTCGGFKLSIKNLVDTKAERGRLEKRLETLTKGIDGARRKLENDRFVASAPAEVVAKEKARLAEMESERDAVTQALSALG